MNKRDFMREYREDIDSVIKAACGEDFRINNAERENWIINDESLYRFAIRKGIRL